MIARYAADDALGRPMGNRFGLQFTAPAALTVDATKATLTVAKEGAAPQSLTDFIDGNHFCLYPDISADDAETLKTGDFKITVTIGFNGVSELQEFVVVVKQGTTLEAAPAVVAA